MERMFVRLLTTEQRPTALEAEQILVRAVIRLL
jgi:hypothetical protein